MHRKHRMYEEGVVIEAKDIDAAIDWVSPLFPIKEFKSQQRAVIHAIVKKDCLVIVEYHLNLIIQSTK